MNRYDEPEYILIADHEEDDDQTDKMDHHHNPLAKVRKRHYDPVSYYETKNDEALTSVYDPVTYHDTQTLDAARASPPGPQYVYDPYKYYQERSHRVQELSVPADTVAVSDPGHNVPLLDEVYEEEVLAHDFDENKDTDQYNLDKHVDHKGESFELIFYVI